MFQCDSLATIWNRVEVAMLKSMSNIKDKYDLVHAISNLDFLSMFFFSLYCDWNWQVVGKCIHKNKKTSETKEITNFTQAVRGCGQ